MFADFEQEFTQSQWFSLNLNLNKLSRHFGNFIANFEHNAFL